MKPAQERLAADLVVNCLRITSAPVVYNVDGVLIDGERQQRCADSAGHGLGEVGRVDTVIDCAGRANVRGSRAGKSAVWIDAPD